MIQITQKTKALILIGLILVATLFAAIYIYQQKKMQALEQNQQIKVGQVKQDDQNQAKKQTVTASTIKGKVTVITKDSIEIDADGEKKELKINDNTAVLAVEGKEIKKMAVADIKKGDAVSVMINQMDNLVLSIQIGKNAGSVF